MRVVVCSPIPGVAIDISVALGAVDIECDVEPSQQEFGSLLFRDRDAIGLFWAMGPASAAEVCRRLRMGDIRNALFAIVEGEDARGRALALLAGADDVQPWPLHPSEIVARLFALARRERTVDGDTYQLPGCTFHVTRGELVGPSGTVHLTKQESKATCMLALYQGHSEPEIKIIDVYVCKLRKKIAVATGGLDVVESVWGKGYRFIREGFRVDRSQGRRVPA